MKKHVHRIRPDLQGYVLIRRRRNYDHLVAFTPTEDKIFVQINSWNVSCQGGKPWILVAKKVVKTREGRAIWRDLRDRGYWRCKINSCNST